MVSIRSFGFGCAFAAGLTLLGSSLVPGAAVAAGADRCRVPDIYFAAINNLDRTESLVRSGKNVRVFMLGPMIGSSSPEPAFESALEHRLPGVDFQITQSVSTGLAEDDFDWMRNVFPRYEPDLVIWQVGVRDAVAASDRENFQRVLDRAANWIDARGADLILVDPPFVPFVQHERIYVPYVGEIGELSRTENVPLIRRYAAMQHLNLAAEKARMPTSAIQPCMPEIMAEAIGRAVAK